MSKTNKQSSNKADKTNVMRLLEQFDYQYIEHTFDSNITDGMQVAKSLGENPDQVFKTLVTVANTKEYFVFVIPVNSQLNLRKAATAAGVKSIQMLKQKDLLPLTGYVHGGCSPIGMKKTFPTIIEELAELSETITFSGGKKGYQVEMSPSKLVEFLSQFLKVKFADICE